MRHSRQQRFLPSLGHVPVRRRFPVLWIGVALVVAASWLPLRNTKPPPAPWNPYAVRR